MKKGKVLSNCNSKTGHDVHKKKFIGRVTQRYKNVQQYINLDVALRKKDWKK